MLTASLRRPVFSCPGNRKHVVTPEMAIDTKHYSLCLQIFLIFFHEIYFTFQANSHEIHFMFQAGKS